MQGNNIKELINVYDKHLSIYGDSDVFVLDKDDVSYASEILDEGGFFCYDEEIIDRDFDLMCYFVVIFLPKNNLAKHATRILETLEKNRVGEHMKFWLCNGKDEIDVKIKIINLYKKKEVKCKI